MRRNLFKSQPLVQSCRRRWTEENNILTLFWPVWGLIPIPSELQSEKQPIAGVGDPVVQDICVHILHKVLHFVWFFFTFWSIRCSLLFAYMLLLVCFLYTIARLAVFVVFVVVCTSLHSLRFSSKSLCWSVCVYVYVCGFLCAYHFRYEHVCLCYCMQCWGLCYQQRLWLNLPFYSLPKLIAFTTVLHILNKNVWWCNLPFFAKLMRTCVTNNG